MYRLTFPTVFLLHYGIGQFIFRESYKVLVHAKTPPISISICFFLYIETLELIGNLGRTKLYCSSMDATETVASPTFFCKIQGWSLTHSLVHTPCVVVVHRIPLHFPPPISVRVWYARRLNFLCAWPVSYTHLTLPTKRIV